ncbi:Nsp1-like C-terminal region-domain-containing protein [Lentinula aff. detonsa]|uniref:Nucleoporin NSP1 n=1 Tax=Lentinula aff. detonsa TaxID=2804958 RepID=A0AA38NSX9_9AGAR|nr:Nsp1-like C-terminal region-domain-containing protein [Lentinula aff. detonsa]
MSFFANKTGSSGQTTGTAGGGLFGGGGPAGTPSMFGNIANQPTGSIFGGGSSTSNTGSGPSLFGGGSASGTSAPTPSLFGGGSNTNTVNNTSAANVSTNTTPSTNPLFGGSLFSLPKPTDQTNAAKPATSSFFSNQTPNTNNPSATTSTPALNTGLFGSTTPKTSEKNAPTTSTIAAPSTGILGGGFFNKPATTTSSTQIPGAPSTSSSSSPFSLGGNTIGSGSTPAAPAIGTGLFGAKPADNVGRKDQAPAAAPGLVTGSLFGAPKPEEKKDGTAAAAAPSVGLNFGLSKPGDKPAGGLLGTFTATTSTAPPVAVQPPSMLRGKTIEEIVNKWSNELETHVKEFNKYAAEVSVWDRALIENSNSLAAIYSHVLAAEREQAEVDQSLDHIEQQQKDLAATLDTYEKVTEEIFGGQGGSLRALDTGPADTERDKNYMLAADLQTHLDDLSGSLTQMIEAVNGLNMPSGSSNSGDPSASGNERSQEDPMGQISQILSSHLDSLQWIDAAAREIEGKITEVERRVGESGHGSGYGVGSGGGSGGSGIGGLGARSRSFRA